jgi:hypothetical protein
MYANTTKPANIAVKLFDNVMRNASLKSERNLQNSFFDGF